MKSVRHILCLSVIIGILSITAAKAQPAEPSEVVIRYFQALKEGNTDLIKSLISGKLHKKKKDLLESNSNYSLFLKRLYQGANTQIIDIVMVGDKNCHVDAEIKLRDGSQLLTRFLLTRNDNDDWQISDEIETP